MANLLEKLSGFDPYAAWQKGKTDKLNEQILQQKIAAGDVSAQQTGQNNTAKSFFMDIMAAFTFADDEQASKKMVQQAISKVPEGSSLAMSAGVLLGKTGGEYLKSLLKAVDFGGRQGFLPMDKSLSDIKSEGILDQFKAKTDRQKADTAEAKRAWSQKYGDIPSGYKMSKDGSGIEPIPGSKDAVSREEKTAKLNRTARDAIYKSDIVLNAVSDAESKIGMFSTGLGSKALSSIGGTQAKDVSELLGTIKANIGFDRLREMRANSPTGGALGQVSEMELTQLERSLTSLEQSQSIDQLKKNLGIVKKHYNRIIKLAEQDYGIKREKETESSPTGGNLENQSSVSNDDKKKAFIQRYMVR